MANYSDSNHLNKNDQQKQGAFYTPRELSLNMAKKTNWKTGQTVFDPTCGKGNLFLAMKEIYPELTNDLIYGIDIDPEAINYCREHFPGGHFVVANYLDIKPEILNQDNWWSKNESKPIKIKKTLEDILKDKNVNKK